MAVESSVQCGKQLKDLVSGCKVRAAEFSASFPQPIDSPTDFIPVASSTDPSVEDLCHGYCVNVLRGCLAPPLLFLPSQILRTDQLFKDASSFVPLPQNLWQWMLSGSPDRPGIPYVEHGLNTIWQSMNVNAIVQLLQNGLHLARTEFRVRIRDVSSTKPNFFL